MAKRPRLKARRQAEARKVDLAVKYDAEGVATGGGHISTKKLRRTLEARFVPMVEKVPPQPRSRKLKRGRHHPPPARPRRAPARNTP